MKRLLSIAVMLVGMLAVSPPARAQHRGGHFSGSQGFAQHSFSGGARAFRGHDFDRGRGFFRGHDFDRGRFRGFFGGVYLGATPYYYYTPGYFYNPGYYYDPGYCSPGYYDVYGNWIVNPYCP